MKNRNTILAIVLLALAPMGLSTIVEAVSPPPDGGYPNFTTAEGTNALKNLTTGVGNTAVGWYSLFSDIDGSFNTAVGAGTLVLNVGDQSAGEGIENTAVGTAALLLNTTGSNNTAVGVTALLNNDTGFNNTATGVNTLSGNTIGVNNTATGAGALGTNTTGNANTAIGVGALGGNTDGGGNTATGTLALSANNGALNTATGLAALQGNTAGDNNTAMGAGALNFNTGGSDNTAYGHQALSDNGDSEKNTAIGAEALQSHTAGDVNTAVGFGTLTNLTSGSTNTAIGPGAGFNLTTGSNNVYIGNVSTGASESGTIRIGSEVQNTQCFIAGIYDNIMPVVGSVDSVTIDLDGRLGRQGSSRRYKEDIKPMEDASEVLYRLEPVMYRYKKDIDPVQRLDYGLIAEDVAQVDPNLAIRDTNGRVDSVRYLAIQNMLLNEFLKEHKRVAELECTLQEREAIIAQQEKSFESKLAEQEKQIEALVSGLQKVSAQIEMSKPATKIVDAGQ